MIKLVVFDWNGTLLSDTAYALEGANRVLESIGGKRITLSHYRETSNIPVIKFYQAHGLTEEEFRRLSPKTTKIFESFYLSKVIKSRTRSGARELLKWLKTHRIRSIILSNHDVEGIKTQLNRLNLGDFDEILANSIMHEALYKGKGDRLGEYIRRKKLDPKEVLGVGDSPEDIEIAKGLGLTSVAIKEGVYSTKRLIQSKPDYLISNLGELIEIVDAINKGII